MITKTIDELRAEMGEAGLAFIQSTIEYKEAMALEATYANYKVRDNAITSRIKKENAFYRKAYEYYSELFKAQQKEGV